MTIMLASYVANIEIIYSYLQINFTKFKSIVKKMKNILDTHKN